MSEGSTKPTGSLNTRVIRRSGVAHPKAGNEYSFGHVFSNALPNKSQDPEIRKWKFRNLANIQRGLRPWAISRSLGIPTLFGSLWIRVFKGPDSESFGQVYDLGLVSMQLVTTVFVNDVVDELVDGAGLADYIYHGIGTGSTAEAAGNTALVTELTTQYLTNSTRATGTQTEGASANIYQTVATNTVDATAAIVEHGIFTSATVGAGILMDRSVFSAINLSASDSIETTYDLTLTAGG